MLSIERYSHIVLIHKELHHHTCMHTVELHQMYLDVITAAPAASSSPYAPLVGDYLNDRLPERLPFNSRYP
jgi:hypothetical protein